MYTNTEQTLVYILYHLIHVSLRNHDEMLSMTHMTMILARYPGLFIEKFLFTNEP